MNNKINLIALLAISAGLYACGSGSGNNSTQTTAGLQGGEYGPIPVNLYDNLLAGKIKPSSLNKKSLQGAGVPADTAAATGVMAAVFPPAAVVLGPISAISGLVAADQVAAQINQINNELNYQESQIQQIYTILNDSYNYFVTQSKVADVSTLNTNYGDWYSDVVGSLLFYGYGASHSQISPIAPHAPIDAIYQAYINEFMLTAPVGPTASINPSVNNNLEAIAANPSTMSAISSLTYGMSTQTHVQQVITNASMSLTLINYGQTIATIESSTDSSSYSLLSSAKTVLEAAIPTVNNPNPYFVNLAESYNNFVNAVYLANVSALQSMYTIEANNNYLNYLNYMAHESGTRLSQICPLEGLSNEATSVNNMINFYVKGSNSDTCATIPTTVYYPSNSYAPTQYSTLTYTNAESALIFAQQQLTQLYARRINMLYQQTMQFIYSDYAYPNQAINYIDGENSLSSNMQTIINSTQQLKSIESTIPGLSMISGNWINSVNLYQYPITNLDVSRANISNEISLQGGVESNTFPVIQAINNSNYPTVYQNIQSGYYDGESISVYNNYISVHSSENPFYFAGYCGIESIGGYSTVESGLSFIGNTALYCNNWSGNIMVNSLTLNSNLDIESSPTMLQIMYSPEYINYGSNYYQYQKDGHSYQYCSMSPYGCMMTANVTFTGIADMWFKMANNANNSYTYYVADSSLSNNFILLASSTYSNYTPGFTLGSGEFYTTGSGASFQLEDGGFEASGPFTHSALMQVTLPNGYNLPFYIISYINNGQTYSGPVIPANLGINGIPVPGIKGWGQQDTGSGGITVETVDKKTYYLNVLQPSDGQGMQYGFFQISTTAQTSCNTGNNNC